MSAQISAEELRRRVAEIPFWYHRIELPHGIVTPGTPPMDLPIPADLTGKRVLDVGAWDGYWTFEAIKRGAREVLAIDDFSDHLGLLREGDRKAWKSFDLCREALGFDESRCQRRELSIYEINPDEHGKFDVVFFFGTLYHLRHPLLALELLANVCESEIYVETAILDDFSPYNGGLGKGYPSPQMVMEFYPGSEYGDNPTNWWAPTLQCLAGMIMACGFPHVKIWKPQPPQRREECRGFARGSRQPID